ncbi:MAG TPA: thiazole synthase [Candidatus Mucispirillum faecigallinarum]|uniref:Thiazole synthase n=1 Tax=Candidatus Mucispirillum faecigallinarum TaxID=2838699 RepID=A0A9D2GTT0_9BACT|nr:thiazole synthase [Candidatus Mucispirillum faecigallinarum]
MSNLVIAGRQFKSRLMIGTGKFQSSSVMKEALEASGAEIVTVALRRVDINNTNDDILSHIDSKKYLLLPNTSGAVNAEEAVRLARLARAAGCEPWVKLEVTPDPYHLLPDPVETLKAAEILVKEGFNVMPYINADPVLAKHLEEAGCVTVMPLAAPIGTNKGIKTLEMVKIIIENANVPVVIDAGLGLPSHAAEAVEIGADAVLVNTAIAAAANPVKMAQAFKYAVQAAEMAVEACPAPVSNYASPSSPVKGLLKDIL